MLTVLFLDDNAASVEEVIDTVGEKHEDWSLNHFQFDEGKTKIRVMRPDMIVLDIWDGLPQESYPEGRDILRMLWDHQFCPVVVYSADDEVVEDYKRHPFVDGVQKGQGSDEEVLEKLEKFLPHVAALRKAEEAVLDTFSSAMKDVAPFVFEHYSDAQQQSDAVVRAGRRRVAALMDEPLPDETKIAAWEQYLSPPVSTDIQLGDILMKEGATSDDPDAFRLVLTPSCDLVSSEERPPKVSHVLVAKCTSPRKGLGKLGLRNVTNTSTLLRRALLTQGYEGSILPLPRLAGKIPSMAADFRDLELIQFDDIGCSNKPFCIIASIDSPFRELVSWAYLQSAGRPGLPDRELDSWSQEIVDAMNAQDGAVINDA